jgi:CO/xanthine dehydrogenase FAD-binding subunit
MYPGDFTYLRAESVAHALELLGEYPEAHSSLAKSRTA